jgi:cholinesterase
LWIYGGAFSVGNSDNAGYNGQYISEQEDVVLVSFNYRLNVFGFPGFPNATQNLGLLDQRLAVEWVQKNIEAFGGDPTRITLFGQSAGSASVDYYTYAWTQDPIAHAFIQESGSVFGPAGGLGSITADEALTYWGNLSAALNCSSTDLACMQSKNYTEIIDALAIVTSGAGSAISSSFGPTVDDIVVFANYTQRSLAGQFIKLPVLLGNADYEAGLFKLLDAFNNDTLSDATWDVFNSDVFTCPAATRANVSISQKVPTWRYRWFGAFPNTQLTTIPYSGAWHASELPVLFGNFPTGNGVPNNTAAETAIGSYLRGAWATFAKNPTSGLETYEDGWPQYNPNQQSLIRLAYQNLTGNNLALGNAYDSTCSQVVGAPLGSNSTNGTSSPSGTSSTSSSPTSSVTPASGGESSRSVSLTSLVLVLGMVMGLVGL